MKILVTNDDGVYAPGIIALSQALSEIAEVIVVAPDRDRSTASKSLTLKAPIRKRVLDNGFVCVQGTPTDCVHLALMGLMADNPPDMIVAGINAGANLGDDVLYSGTVAAATEGRFLGYPAVATSLVGDLDNKHYVNAAQLIKNIVLNIQHNPLPQDSILNVNIPGLSADAIKGYQVTRLGQRHQSEAMIQAQDPRGETVYWVGPPGKEQDAGEGTDFHAIREGYVSITPLQMDLTRYDQMETVSHWVDGLTV